MEQVLKFHAVMKVNNTDKQIVKRVNRKRSSKGYLIATAEVASANNCQQDGCDSSPSRFNCN